MSTFYLWLNEYAGYQANRKWFDVAVCQRIDDFTREKERRIAFAVSPIWHSTVQDLSVKTSRLGNVLHIVKQNPQPLFPQATECVAVGNCVRGRVPRPFSEPSWATATDPWRHFRRSRWLPLLRSDIDWGSKNELFVHEVLRFAFVCRSYGRKTRSRRRKRTKNAENRYREKRRRRETRMRNFTSDVFIRFTRRASHHRAEGTSREGKNFICKNESCSFPLSEGTRFLVNLFRAY